MPNSKIQLYFLCKLLGLFHLARWITRDRLRILCYHGFAIEDETDFRPQTFIKPERFEHRLATIQRYGFRVLPLDDAVERLYSGSLPEYVAVITVDDGFHSFHRVAVPYLRSYAFPATVYVTSYYVEKESPVFRLVVQYMFWKTTKKELLLKDVQWSTNQVVDLLNSKQTKLTMWNCIDYGEHECTEEMRWAICKELGVMLDIPYEDIVRSKILHLMNLEELRSLAAANIDVQLHTHRHSFPIDSETVARREITENRAAIKQWLDADANHFCYPSGIWDRRQWVWLESMQVKSSTTCDRGTNSDKTPRHALRRFLDGEKIHQLEFEAELTGFADILRKIRTLSKRVLAII